MFNFFDKIEDFHRQVFQHHERQIARMFDHHSRHFNIRENRNSREKREVNFFPAITSSESYCSTKTPKSAPFIVGKSNILAREGISPVKHSDTSLPSTPKSESNIDKGWIDNSSYGTCKILQCGLQTQFEFSPISNAPVSCIYQPKSKLLQGALNDSEYNIKFSIKLMSKPDSATKLTQVKADVRNKYNNSKLKDKLCLLFSFISPENPYYYLELPFYDDYVKLFKYENKESFLIDSVQNEFLTKIKSNTFSSFDFRVDKISVLLKINENIVFEYNFDKFSENKLNGFIGLLYFGKRCKYAIKEFNLISKDKTSINKTSSSTIENSRLPSSTRLEENKISHNQKQKETIFQPKDLGANISKAAEKLPMHEKKMVYLIMSEIVQRDLGITYDNIAGLVEAKKVIHEAILLPILLPEMFHGIREPWKGCLLFGPPGTGKTLLAKAVSGIEKCTFFNCSSSTLVSKYRGDSEKIIRCLFDVARLHSPSVIFIDEVDALVSTRNSDAEHEASRRLKTEFFTQFDGIASTNTSTSVNIYHYYYYYYYYYYDYYYYYYYLQNMCM